jgi:L-iditol 2-dehydrogenase
MTRKGGDITVMAHFDKPFMTDIGLAVKNGINLYTVRGEGRMSCHRALSLMEEGKINGKALITHTFPLENINEALATFAERRDDALKVVVHS